ncbi:MAG: hypothetical protein IKV55_04890 [Oscillospiraceae bacterium]|nr:hypothetical protein [Oscillospiraceae bacterium]
MSGLFAALSALCIPAAAAGLLLGAFCSAETGFFVLRGIGGLLPAALPALLLAAAHTASRLFIKDLDHTAPRRTAAARVLFVAGAAALITELPALVQAVLHAENGRNLLAVAALIFEVLFAAWLLLQAFGLPEPAAQTTVSLWYALPVCGCTARLLHCFFAAAVNPRDVRGMAQLLGLCALAVLWQRLLQHRIHADERSALMLLRSALAALYFMAGMLLPALLLNAPLFETLRDAVLCLCGWAAAGSCFGEE